MSRGLRALGFAALLCLCPVALAALSPQTNGPQRPEIVEASAAAAAAEDLYARGEYAQAGAEATRALAIYERLDDPRGVGRARHVLGIVASMMGDAAEAKRQFEAAITAFENAGYRRGRAIATLGLLTVTNSLPDTTLWERVLADARSAGDKTVEGRALHNWGDRLFAAGEYEAALEKLERAAALFEEVGNRVALGTIHNSLGRLYRTHGRPDLALREQLAALALHENSPATFEHVQSLNAVASTYQALGDTRQARTYFDRALVLAERTGSPRVQDLIRANLAGALFDEGEYAKAAQLLEQVLAHGRDSYPSIRYSALSEAYLKSGRREEALAAAQKALDLCAPDQGTECLNALNRRASAHAGLGNPQAALADVRAALERLEGLRARLVPADFLKQQFGKAEEAVYSHAIAIQLGQRQRREAVATAELARSRAFIDLLAAREFPDPSKAGGEQAAVTPATRQLPLVLRGAASEPASDPGQREPTLLHLPSPVFAKSADSFALASLAARLNSTLLLYWVADDNIYIWVVTAGDEIRTARVAVRGTKLRELVRSTMPFGEENAAPARGQADPGMLTRGAMTMALQQGQRAAWRELYNLLIQPVRAALPRRAGALITIVPHGPLTGLSFAALQNERGRYLLEDYALHYVPAAAVLQFTEGKRQPDARNGRIMLVADPTVPARSRFDEALPPLPGARTEVRAISSLVARRRVTMLEGSTATESTVRAAAADKAVLHFATHAIVNDDDPFGSFLALRPSASDAGADGYLTAREIYGLNLHADLVVLSACRSGSGQVAGDGIASFARAFIYAGTPSVVTSLWDVADQPTNRLLPDFYRSWFGGLSKARALRAAELKLLADLRAGRVQIRTPAGLVTLPEHPVFWAGFALIGEPQ